MSSRIEQLIDEIEEYIESCKPKFMSNTEIIVNKDEIDELYLAWEELEGNGEL